MPVSYEDKIKEQACAMNGEGSCRRRVLLVSAVQMMKVLWLFGIALRREVSSRLGAALAEDCRGERSGKRRT